MKRLTSTILTLLIFVFLCAPQPLQAASYYFDLASGNDSTGDGTYGNPWKTIDKCTTTRSAGDECRAALTTITTLAGTLTFTNGSTSVATSSDLTAVVAAGDVVGKNTGVDGWWVVASLNSSAITLVNQYWATTGSGSAATGYKITPVTASERLDINSSGTEGSLIKISGGWDLSTQTKTGITAVLGYSTTAAIYSSAKSYIEISDFVLVETSAGSAIYTTGATVGWYLHDLWLTAKSGANAYTFTADAMRSSILSDIYITSQANTAIFITVSQSTFTNIYVYSPANASNMPSVSITGSFNIFENLRVYNSYDDNLTLATEGSLNVFNNCIFDTNRNAGSFAANIGFGSNRFYSCTFSNTTGADINLSSNIYENYFIGCTLTDYTRVTTIDSPLLQQLIIAPAASDSYIVFCGGIVTMDSSAAARSGKALKFTPSNATGAAIKVGTVKVPSAASDLTVSAYIKDDADFNGSMIFMVLQNGQGLSVTERTLTTSYAKSSVTIPLASLVADSYIDLYVLVTGTAGNAWVDDFIAEQ